MKHQMRTMKAALTSAVLSLAMIGCGSNAPDATTLSGVATVEDPLGGAKLTLQDASLQQKSSDTAADGSFSFDVTGMRAPFTLRADWNDATGAHTLRSVADRAGHAHVDPLTEGAVAAAHHDESDGHDDGERTAAYAGNLLGQLRGVLAPLFDRYGIGSDLLQSDPVALRALYRDVRFQFDDGTLTVTNRATGAVIYAGPVANPDASAFHPENMPAGPGTTPTPPAACTYTYTAWGACQSNGTQSRTVTTSTPAGCTGTPALSQACTYTPPPPSACSYTYSAWGACQSSGTQSRTVLVSTPAGCTGSPALTQACTYTPPPPAACTYTYSAWGACQSSGTQSRTVTASTPAGCTGTPALSQACTYTPPIDGAALYTQYCSGCHGTSKKGSSVSAIQGAISSNRGGMGSLSSLTPAQIQAISTAP